MPKWSLTTLVLIIVKPILPKCILGEMFVTDNTRDSKGQVDHTSSGERKAEGERFLRTASRHLEEKGYIASVGDKHHAMMIYTRKIGDKDRIGWRLDQY